jgi:hypothetical protein
MVIFHPRKREERSFAIMYSEKLQQFVSSHTPEKVVWDLETISSLAAKAGLEVRPSHREGELEVVSWGGLSDRPKRVKISKGWGPFREAEWADHPSEKESFFKKLSFKENMEITWFRRIDGTKLVFWPYCRYSSGSFGTGMKEPGQALMEAAGLHEVVFSLPEQVVTLPKEPWRVVDVSQDVYYFLDETETLFASEVEARVTPFIDELQKLVEECKGSKA